MYLNKDRLWAFPNDLRKILCHTTDLPVFPKLEGGYILTKWLSNSCMEKLER